jgi:hypothetical protein
MYFCSLDSISRNVLLLERPRLLAFRFCKHSSQASLLVRHEQESLTLKDIKLGSELASRIKPTKVVVGNTLPKNKYTKGGSFQNKIMKNELPDQKLQII